MTWGMPMQILKVGDKTEDDSLVVLDEDRLCYSVRSISNGGVGVRTISKALLAEWIEAYTKTPNVSSQVIREQLVGKSDIDRFEYGYAGTLAKMAKMVLGQISVVRPNGEEIRRNEFYDYMLRVEKKSPKTAKDTSGTYLPSISDDLAPRTASVWHGLREYLYNKKPAKKIYAVDSLAELDELYGGLDRIFQQDGEAGDLDPLRFKECKDWVDSPNNHNSVRAAWGMYKRFMQWREAQKKPEDKTDEPPPNVDRLSVALKLFDEKRKETGDGGWFDVGRSVNGRIREYFDPLTESAIKSFDAAKIAELFCGFKDADGKTFETMWSGKNGQGWGHIKPADEQAVKDIVDFLVELKTDASVSARFLDKDFVRPAGFGRSVISELLMKFHPDSCLKHGERSHIALVWLGLIDFDWRNDYSDAEYKQVCGAAAKILQKMQAMKIPRLVNADGLVDNSPPDYLTVNEFIYFVNTNQDLIKEKIMGNAMKKGKPQKHKGEKALEWKKGSKDNELLLRLLASLRAKPFAILAGHSGTGKSRYVKKLAYMTCNAEELRNEKQLPGNYLLLQVKPNWHDSTDLLGYRNAITEGKYQPTELIKFIFRAYQFSETPFFLCLDEMNLAPVEQYFAEFLSAMESKEPVPLNDISEKEGNLFELGCEWEDSLKYLKENGFSIPKNLFIVGTVNMDETTNQFSRKVLDRAFTIEMTDVDFANYGNVTEPSYADTIKEETIEQLLAGEKLVKELDEEDKKEDSSLIKVQKALAATPFAIAYRFANEYTLLKRAIETFDPQGTMTLDALDQAVLMKILPRIAGERDYIEKVYGDKETVGLRSALVGKTVSLDKINEILERAKNTNANYITFWP